LNLKKINYRIRFLIKLNIDNYAFTLQPTKTENLCVIAVRVSGGSRNFEKRKIQSAQSSFIVNAHNAFMYAPLWNTIQLSGHPILHETLMLLNQFNVDLPNDCQPLVTCHTMIV